MPIRKCTRCFSDFEDDDTLVYNPARDLGDVFISGIGDVRAEDLCPQCREELGIINLMGFRP